LIANIQGGTPKPNLITGAVNPKTREEPYNLDYLKDYGVIASFATEAVIQNPNKEQKDHARASLVTRAVLTQSNRYLKLCKQILVMFIDKFKIKETSTSLLLMH
jgi:hypothetical protein